MYIFFMCNLVQFGWKTLGLHNVPFITRVINGKHILYIAVRIDELGYQLIYSRDNFFICDLVKSFTITAPEETLFNEINTTH